MGDVKVASRTVTVEELDQLAQTTGCDVALIGDQGGVIATSKLNNVDYSASDVEGILKAARGMHNDTEAQEFSVLWRNRRRPHIHVQSTANGLFLVMVFQSSDQVGAVRSAACRFTDGLSKE